MNDIAYLCLTVYTMLSTVMAVGIIIDFKYLFNTSMFMEDVLVICLLFIVGVFLWPIIMLITWANRYVFSPLWSKFKYRYIYP